MILRSESEFSYIPLLVIPENLESIQDKLFKKM